MDGGLQSVYKEVIGWKMELSYAVPEVYMISKGKTWIKLQIPRKSYVDIVKSVLIVICCLHFAKRNIHATRNDFLRHLLKILSSYELVERPENSLSAHLPLIQSAVAKDKDLAKSKDNRTSNKSKFIVYDDDFDFDDEPEGVFDSVCAFCDNGGDVLSCEGQSQYEAIETFFCDNCKHQCFVCGMLGSSDTSSAFEVLPLPTLETNRIFYVFPCVSATCGHFYHPECVANSLYPSDETLAKQLKNQIAAGESFTCPIHKCLCCQQGENKDEYELQFAICRGCPTAYHRKCLPKKIAFNASADGTIQQRAWHDLLPQRILMYCITRLFQV
ncbi:hypothetical protein L1987_02175 [Smallanthus sonchifolius]|uniref:Uncharacterized protein n=1 Tax=Smallanthus sonchifolius TaxID=185202 RepID=A0ACB9K735_9ASTR|nr:hypothetical protein L1987_02175 [Smallanthus sonchifolius]